jgi:hypothetical protein
MRGGADWAQNVIAWRTKSTRRGDRSWASSSPTTSHPKWPDSSVYSRGGSPSRSTSAMPASVGAGWNAAVQNEW